MPTVPPAPRTSAARRSGQLLEVLGHGPAEGDDALAGLGVEVGEELLVLGDPFTLDALGVEDDGERAVALHPELAVGVAGRDDAVALGEATAPGPLLTRRLVLAARDEVAEGLEGLVAGGVREPGG